MDATINIEQTVLEECGLTADQFHDAACYALGNLSHPDTGMPIYFSRVRVSVNVIQTAGPTSTGGAEKEALIAPPAVGHKYHFLSNGDGTNTMIVAPSDEAKSVLHLMPKSS